MRQPSPGRRILDLLTALPRVDGQNRLLRVSDRDLALALLYMEGIDRDRVLDLVGTGKSSRVRLELDRIERSRVEYRHHEMAAALVARVLEGSATRGASSFYRPSRVRRLR
jgi:hypothetical protein